VQARIKKAGAGLRTIQRVGGDQIVRYPTQITVNHIFRVHLVDVSGNALAHISYYTASNQTARARAPRTKQIQKRSILCSDRCTPAAVRWRNARTSRQPLKPSVRKDIKGFVWRNYYRRARPVRAIPPANPFCAVAKP